jgi:hypothetical protein
LPLLICSSLGELAWGFLMLTLELSGWYHLRPFLDFWAVEVDNKLFDFRWDGKFGRKRDLGG